MPILTSTPLPYQGLPVRLTNTSNNLTLTPAVLRATAADKRFVVCGVGVICTAGTPESCVFMDEGATFFSFVPPVLNQWIIIPFGAYPYVSVLAGNDLKVAENTGAATQKCLWFGFEV